MCLCSNFHYLGGGYDAGDGRDEEVVERRQEGVAVDVVESDGDAVSEQVVSDETHVQTTHRRHLVHAVCINRASLPPTATNHTNLDY